MDKFGEYLDVLPLPFLVLALVLALAGFQLIPPRWRLQASLATMAFTLAISKLSGFGPVAAICKAGSFATFMTVAISAYRQPGHRMKLNPVAWGYLAIGLLAIFFVFGTLDRLLSVVIRLQWVFLIAAAILTARTVVDRQSMERILIGILFGMVGVCAITSIELLTNPGAAAFRFMPFGSNPNLIAIAFALTATFGLYFAVSSRRRILRLLFFGVMMLGLAQLIVSTSRGGLLIFGVTSLPILLYAFRKSPAFGIFFVLSVVVAGGFVTVKLGGDTDFSRMGLGYDKRGELWQAGWQQVIKRPLFGLLFSTGEYGIHPEDNPHNAYIEFLYLGGLALGIPLFFIQLYGYLCAIRLWIRRRSSPLGPLLTSMIVASAPVIFVHGFINATIYYPTHTWAFLNILYSCLYMSLVRFKKQSPAAVARSRRRPATAIPGNAGRLPADPG